MATPGLIGNIYKQAGPSREASLVGTLRRALEQQDYQRQQNSIANSMKQQQLYNEQQNAQNTLDVANSRTAADSQKNLFDTLFKLDESMMGRAKDAYAREWQAGEPERAIYIEAKKKAISTPEELAKQMTMANYMGLNTQLDPSTGERTFIDPESDKAMQAQNLIDNFMRMKSGQLGTSIDLAGSLPAPSVPSFQYDNSLLNAITQLLGGSGKSAQPYKKSSGF